MVFALASCGGDDGGSSESEELVVGTYSEGSNCIMDPQMTSSYGDWQYVNQMYDTIVTTDFDGETIKDALAESWEVSDDGMTYTFHLKDGIKFHSGKALTSEDVRWTWERWRTESGTCYSYYLDFVDTIETPDEKTVVVNMSKPDNNFLVNMTVPVASIMNKDAIEQAEADNKVYGVEVVDGTGPFKLEEYVASDYLKMTRNDDYTWGSSIFENQGPAHISGIKVRFVPEPGTRQMEFEAGNIDVLGNGCVFANELDGLLEKGDYTLEEYNPPYPVFLMFQTERVPDKAVRQACNMAIDRDEIINTVMGGHCEAMYTGLPEGYKWNWKEGKDYYKYDLEAAGKLLEDNGYKLESDGYRYKDGEKLSMEISYCDSDEDAKTAELFQAQMKKIGIDVIVNTSTADFWDRIGGDGDNDFDVLIMGTYINSAEDMLQEYMYSKNMPAPNRSKWSDPEVDKLLAEARSTTDETRRMECYEEIQKVAAEEAIWVPLYSKNGWSVLNNRVKGYKAHPTIMEGEPKFLDVSK
jgi:ABC-type transport system substrate-binding protein